MIPTAERSPEVQSLRLTDGMDEHADQRAVRTRFFAKLQLLWMRRRLISRAALVGLICFTVIAFLIPKRYESTVHIMPPDADSSGPMAMISALTGGGGGAGGAASSIGSLAGSVLGMKSTGAIFMGVLHSRTVADHVITTLELQKVYHIPSLDLARLRLANNTVINDDRKSGIIELTVTDRDPKRAAAIGTEYVHELDVLMAQLSTSSARRERIFLEDRLKGVKLDLEAAENAFSQFASKNGAIDVPAQGKAMVDAAAIMQGQLMAAESELQGLKQIFTADNIRVKSTQARIDELQRQLQRFGGSSKASSGSAADGAEFPSIRQLPVLGVPYADYYRTVKIQEAVFETLTKEYELAKVQEAKEIPSVKVLDPAQIPEHKSYPPRLLIMFIGTVLTIGFVVIWILGEAYWDRLDSHDPGKQLATEVFQAAKMRSTRALARIRFRG